MPNPIPSQVPLQPLLRQTSSSETAG